jgi:molybdenum cofactor synthesis domain-containing protein
MSTFPVQIVERAALILTGSEILRAKVQESNLHPLASTLRALGISLERASIIPDDRALIAAEIRSLIRDYDVVFMSGGIGPTHDDVTLEAVADAHGVTAQVHPELRKLLEQVYQERLTAAHLRMGLVPTGADLVSLPEILWPTVVMGKVWILPGVPELFRMKLSVVRAYLRGPQSIVGRAAYTMMDEAELKPLLDEVVRDHPLVSVGSYPKWFDPTYKTKITFDGSNTDDVERALAALLCRLPAGEPQRTE